MDGNPVNLVRAVSKAVGRGLDVNVNEDCFTIQRGCYILNTWGYGPVYDYGIYIYGPYSEELAKDCEMMGSISDGFTCVPDDVIDQLHGIFEKGPGYAEAYAMVLLVKNNNHGVSFKTMQKVALNITPYLKDEVEEVCALLL